MTAIRGKTRPIPCKRMRTERQEIFYFYALRLIKSFKANLCQGGNIDYPRIIATDEFKTDELLIYANYYFSLPAISLFVTYAIFKNRSRPNRTHPNCFTIPRKRNSCALCCTHPLFPFLFSLSSFPLLFSPISTNAGRTIFTAIALVTTGVAYTRETCGPRTRFRFPGSGKTSRPGRKRVIETVKSYARLPPRRDSKRIRDSKSERGRDGTKFLRAVRSTEWVCQRRNIIAFTGTAVGTPLFSFPFRTSQ